ncbi:PKS-NRPS hybrid synthetase [Glycine max]|nr:PKS-NRPS hybrid synthetase [Glycine max]
MLYVCHPNAVKLCNACNLVFLIDNTYKINRYKLPLLDFIGVTPAGMTFSTGFAYLEGERLNNMVWALERFQGLFLRRDAFLGVIVTDRDLALMNAVKTVFPECTNLWCWFYINKNYAMDAWGSLADCRSKHQFDDCLKKFEIACSPWPMFVDYVNETWVIPHKENFVKAWTNKVMHLGNTTTNSLGDLCSVWDALSNMITLQHTETKASMWMDINDMGYVIASRYSVILVSLSLQQNMTFFPLRSQPPTDSFVHRIICIGHIFGNNFVQVYLKDHCPLPPLALLWSWNCHP